MTEFRIFTEGPGDVAFIRDYVESEFEIKLSDNFDLLKSWSGYKAGGKIYGNIQQTHFDKKEIILILDADKNFEERRTEVLTDFKGFNIPVHLFLFPNNSGPGNIEDLLTEIAADKKLMNCFLAYENCVEGYERPLTKSRIYAYLDALLPAESKSMKKDMRRDEYRNYKNPAHWDLRHEILHPLRNFLSPFLLKAAE